MKKRRSKIIFFTGRYSYFVFGLFCLSFFIILITGIVNQLIFDGKLPGSYFIIAGIFAGIIQIINGLITAVHREVPRSGGFHSITGVPALVISVIYIMLWVVAVGGLVWSLISYGFLK